MMIIAYILCAFFLFASSIKILGWQKKIFETQMEFMAKYGLSRQQFRLIGCLELTGAIAILFAGSLIGFLGAGLLAGVSAGAIFFHLRFDTWKDGIPAMVTLALSSILALMQLGTVVGTTL